MSKAAPWNIKGIDYEVRSAAREAARRSGMSLSDWLNSVIADQASDMGVHPDDFDDENRQQAISARLESMNYNHGRRGRRSDRPYAPVPAYERDHDAYESAGHGMSYDIPYAPRSERYGAGPDSAVDLVQRRLANIEAAIGNRDGSRTDRDRELRRTLSRLEARMETLAPHDEDEDFVGGPARSRGKAPGQRRNRGHAHAAADELQQRLNRIEARLENRSGKDGDKELRRTLSRLEARIESLADGREPEKASESISDVDRKLSAIADMLSRRTDSPAHVAAPAEAPASEATRDGMRPKELARIEAKLNMLLSRENTAPASPSYLDPYASTAQDTYAPAVVAPPGVPPARRSLADSIADINRRQQSLDAGPRRPARGARPAFDPAMKAPVSPDQRQLVTGSDSVRQDLRAIAAQLEGLRRPAEEAAGQIQQTANAQQEKTNAAIEQLGQQIAEVNRTISGLAPRQSLATIETAIRDLTDRVVQSRQDGVRESVLSPIETLIGDLKHSIEARNAGGQQAQPAIDELRQQMADMARAITRIDPKATLSTLEHAIRDLSARVDSSRQGGVKEAILQPIEDLIGELRQSVARGARSPQLDTIERELHAINQRMDQLGSTSSGDDPRLQEIHQQTSSIKELLSAAVSRPLPVEKIERQINALGKRIDLIASRGSSPVGAAAVSENVDEIRAALQQPYPSMEMAAIQDKIETLSEKFDDLLAHKPDSNSVDAISARLDAVQASIFQRLDQPSDEVSQTARKLEELMLEIRDRLDINARSPGADGEPDRIEEHIRSLSQKIDTVSTPLGAEQLSALEERIRSLAEKIDTVAANPLAPGNTALEALEAQVREIAERIEHPNVSLATLSTIEQTMTDLLNQIEETRLSTADAAENAARNATREALDELLTRGALANMRNEDSRELITRELSGLRTAQDAKDQRTQATLSAVHETLEKVVDRLAMLEDNIETRPAVARAGHPGTGRRNGMNSDTGARPRDSAASSPEVSGASAAQSLASGPAPLFERRPSAQPLESAAAPDVEMDFAKSSNATAYSDRSAAVKPDALNLSPDAAALWQDGGDDELLEPGSGTPAPHTSMQDRSRQTGDASHQFGGRDALQSGDDTDADGDLDLNAMSGGKSSSSFIAAARRASIAAQAEADAAAAQEPRKRARKSGESTLSDARARAAAAAASLSGKLERDKSEKALAPEGTSDKRSALRKRKVLLSLGLAAAVLVLGTLQMLRSTGHNPSGPDVIGAPKAPITKPATPPNTAPSNNAATPGKATNSALPANPANLGDSLGPREKSPNRPPASTLQNGAMLNNGFSRNNLQATNSNRFVKQPSARTDRTSVASIPANAGAFARPATNDLLKEARSGNASAQYELAVRFIAGRTIPRDYDEAVALLEKASAQGLAQAQYRLGSLYEKGTGVKKDPSRALELYERAGNAGNIRAMHNYAVLAAEGATGKPDYAKAASWFRKAAQHGVRDSQYNLAILYARGLGIARSMSQSYFWFSIAAAQGDKDAASKRDQVARKMSASELERARKSVAAFSPLPKTETANSVAEPKDGWQLDAAAVRSQKTSGARTPVNNSVPLMARNKLSRS